MPLVLPQSNLAQGTAEASVASLNAALQAWASQMEARVGQNETAISSALYQLGQLIPNQTVPPGSGSGGGGGGGSTIPAALYRPTTYVDGGDIPVKNPGYAFDSSRTTAALEQSRNVAGLGLQQGDITFSGFSSFVTIAAQTLYIILSTSITAGSSGSVAIYINGNLLYTSFSTTGKTIPTLSIPIGTQISDYSIEILATAGQNKNNTIANAYIYDIGIY